MKPLEADACAAEQAWRADFPVLDQAVNGRPLVYLDSAASAQQPRQVSDAVAAYHRHDHANVHRGVHTLSQRATDAYESARDKIRRFVGATSRREIVFTSGTTESINLVAQAWARPRLGEGDRIVATHLEHHSNFVPWQLVAEQTGAEFRVGPVLDDGQVDLESLAALLDAPTRLLAIGHVSNAIGTINPVREICRLARDAGVIVVIDGAQAAPHLDIDVADLGCDFYAFSGHKMYGPTGTGVLYGREALLDAMPPWKGGGEMILEVSLDHTVYNELPYKFEAGTPNIAGFVGLGAAVDYLNAIGHETLMRVEAELYRYLVAALESIDELRLIGTAPQRIGVQSFLVGDIHPHDLGTLLDQQGVAVRTGHHCAMPAMTRFDVPGTARASLGLYNTREDVDRLVTAIDTAKTLFA